MGNSPGKPSIGSRLPWMLRGRAAADHTHHRLASDKGKNRRDMDDERLARIVAAAVAQGIAGAGLAKKEDLQNLAGKIDATAGKMANKEERIFNLERIAADTTIMGSAGSTPGPGGICRTGSRSTMTAASQQYDWRPKLTKMGGWAPHGCTPEETADGRGAGGLQADCAPHAWSHARRCRCYSTLLAQPLLGLSS